MGSQTAVQVNTLEFRNICVGLSHTSKKTNKKYFKLITMHGRYTVTVYSVF